MELKYDAIQEGEALPTLIKDPITQTQLVRYSGASGDFNPIHTIPEYAKEAGLDGTIAHGMLIMGILGQLVSNWAGIKAVKKYGVSFKGMTKPGDVLTASGAVKKKYDKEGEHLIDCNIKIEDQTGDLKVEGKVTIAL